MDAMDTMDVMDAGALLDDEVEDDDIRFDAAYDIIDGPNVATENDAKKKFRALIRFTIFTKISNHEEEAILNQYGDDSAGGVLARYYTYFSQYRKGALERPIIRQVLPDILQESVTEKAKQYIRERHGDEPETLQEELVKGRVSKVIDELVDAEIKRSFKVVSPAALKNEMKYVFDFAKDHYTNIDFPQCSGVGRIAELHETSKAYGDALSSAATVYGGSIMSDNMKANPIFFADKERLIKVCSPSPHGKRDKAAIEFLYQTGVRPGNILENGKAKGPNKNQSTGSDGEESNLEYVDKDGNRAERLFRDQQTGRWAIEFKPIKDKTGASPPINVVMDEVASSRFQDFLNCQEFAMWNGKEVTPAIFGFNSVEAIDKMLYTRGRLAGYPLFYFSSYGFRVGKLNREYIKRMKMLCSMTPPRCGAERKKLMNEAFESTISSMGWRKGSTAPLTYLRNQADTLALSDVDCDDASTSILTLHPDLRDSRYGDDASFPKTPHRQQKFASNEGYTERFIKEASRIYDALAEDSHDLPSSGEILEDKSPSDLLAAVASLLYEKRSDEESFDAFLNAAKDTSEIGNQSLHQARTIIVRSLISTGALKDSNCMTIEVVPPDLLEFTKLPRETKAKRSRSVRRLPVKHQVKGTSSLRKLKHIQKKRARPRATLQVMIDGQLHEVPQVSEDVCQMYDDADDDSDDDDSMGVTNDMFSDHLRAFGMLMCTGNSHNLPSTLPLPAAAHEHMPTESYTYETMENGLKLVAAAFTDYADAL